MPIKKCEKKKVFIAISAVIVSITGKRIEKWECKQCGHRTTLRSGTVMQSSKLPFQYWFLAMHLLTSTKKSFSAKEIQRQIGHKRYEPIWAMVP